MTSRTGNKRGFTLVEVMAATCLLALGSVTLFGSFFSSLDAYTYYRDYLLAAPEAEEMLWTACHSITYSNGIHGIPGQGTFARSGRVFSWALSESAVDESAASKKVLHKVNVRVSWKAGRRNVSFDRSTYALFAGPQ